MAEPATEPVASLLPHTHFADWRDTFLQHLSAGCSVTKAAALTRKSRLWVYEARKESEEFAQAWLSAIELRDLDRKDRSDTAMWSRHVEGTKRPVFYQGEQCGSVQEYDTPAGKAWAAAHDTRYRQIQVPAPIQYNRSLTIIQQATPQQITEVRALAHAMLLGPSTVDVDTTPSE